MFPILPIIAVIGYTSIICKLFRANFESSISFSLSVITLMLYIGAYNYYLNYVSQGIIFVGIFFLVFSIFFKIYQNYKINNFIHGYDQKSVLIILTFLISAILLWKISLNQVFFAWDDFSHWGMATKELFYTNQLSSKESQLIFKDYPPGGSLFNYFILKGNQFIFWEKNQKFNESVALFAQSIPLLSNFILLFGYCLRKINITVSLIVFLTQICLYFALGYVPNTLMIDGLVACSFCSALLLYFINGRTNKAIILAIPSILCLIILKNVGVYFAWLSMTIIVMDQILSINQKDFKIKNSVKSLTKIGIIGSCILLIINTQLSWKNYYLGIEEEAKFKITVRIVEILKALFISLNDIESTIKLNFFIKFIPIHITYPNGETNFIINNTVFIVFIFLIYSIFQLYKLKISSNRDNFATYAILIIGFILYSIGLLVLYLFSFSQYEAIRLASFDRYIGVYLYGAIPVTLYMSLQQITENQKNLYVSLIIFLILLISISANNIVNYIIGKKNSGTQNFITKVNSIIDNTQLSITSDTKVYFISQCDAGLEILMFKYLVYPSKVSKDNYSIGNPCNKDDVWTINIPKEKLKSLLLNYDYLVISKTNNSLYEQYGDLFNTNLDENSVYKINKINNNLIFQKIN